VLIKLFPELSVTLLLCYCFREDVAKLLYITMCIKESLRLYPPAGGVGKLLSEDMVINGQRFPKGI